MHAFNLWGKLAQFVLTEVAVAMAVVHQVVDKNLVNNKAVAG